MKCDICHKAAATIHWTQVVNGAVRSMHLCEACARERGINLEDPGSLNELLANMGLATEAPPPASEGPEPCCSSCGLTMREFRKAGRLGCPSCYGSFSSELEQLFQQMQRGERHTGRRPPGAVVSVPSVDPADVQRALEQAIAEERFEDAARLRDHLAALRRRPTPPAGEGGS